jgi:hypothetical protein
MNKPTTRHVCVNKCYVLRENHVGMHTFALKCVILKRKGRINQSLLVRMSNNCIDYINLIQECTKRVVTLVLKTCKYLNQYILVRKFKIPKIQSDYLMRSISCLPMPSSSSFAISSNDDRPSIFRSLKSS